MTKELSPAVIAYQQAIVDNHAAVFRECFREDAVVTDNGKTYRDLDEIKDWGDELSKINSIPASPVQLKRTKKLRS